jgi:flagellar biosynthesis regulator FlaF
MERLLIIKAKGGLGNRILSAVSGLAFAEMTNRTPIIDWRDGSYAPLGENAYPHLFDTPITLPCDIRDADSSMPSPAIWGGGNLSLTPQAMIDKYFPQSHSSPTVYRKLCTDLNRLDASEDTAVFWCYLPKFARLRRHLLRHPAFAGQSIEAIIKRYLESHFTPNSRLRTRVAAQMAKIPGPVIGVHIRFTDRKIPLDKVQAKLRRRLRQMPDASIFLATDNADVQATIAAEFKNVFFTSKFLDAAGNRLHHPDSTVDKLAEAENAIVDIWMLSQCDHLIHSRHSTFSETSAILGGLTGPRRDDVDRFNPYVLAKRLIQAYA